jgi:hypothetical protein
MRICSKKPVSVQRGSTEAVVKQEVFSSQCPKRTMKVKRDETAFKQAAAKLRSVKKMRREVVNGEDRRDFDPEREIIRLQPSLGRTRVRAYY